MESVDAEEPGQTQRAYEHQEKNVHDRARQQLAPSKPGGKKNLEPSPKWKGLGLPSGQQYVAVGDGD